MARIQKNWSRRLFGFKILKLDFDTGEGFDWYFGIGFSLWSTGFSIDFGFLSVQFSTRRSHAGLEISMCFPWPRFYASFCIEDSRHWNYKDNCWETEN